EEEEETESEEEKSPLQKMDFAELKPMIARVFDLNAEETDSLIALRSRMLDLEKEKNANGQEAMALVKTAHTFIDGLRSKERKGHDITDLYGLFNLTDYEKRKKDSLNYLIRGAINRIPKEFLRADGLVEPSYIEHLVKKTEFGKIVYKAIENNEAFLASLNMDKQQLAALLDITEDEVDLLKATPGQLTLKSSSMANKHLENGLPTEITTHIDSGNATESFKKRMVALEKKRKKQAKLFLKKAKKAEDEFYKLNPSWYSSNVGRGETYLSEQGQFVFLPLGALSFVDNDVSFIRGERAEKANPKTSLGVPDYEGLNSDYENTMCNLGLNGIMVLEFVDNVLIDVNGPDLFIFEVGEIEPTKLEISSDGVNWVAIGKIDGGTAMVDIANYVVPNQRFNYIRLTDLETASEVPGADIDAVAAIGGALRMSLDSSVLFDTGEHVLKPEGLAAIKELAQKVTLLKKGKVMVEGHTDDVGNAVDNQKLSLERARSVSQTLKEYLSGKKFQFGEKGYGENQPIVKNDSEENRQKNRRVEIVVIPF
ncbi:MAG: OmpA family protein, partial [Bacteroidota bacterium]